MKKIKIPFRVFVYNILPFFTINVQENAKPKDLAFYFKRDRYRTIFYWNFLIDLKEIYSIDFYIKDAYFNGKKDSSIIDSSFYLNKLAIYPKDLKIIFGMYFFTKYRNSKMIFKESKEQNLHITELYYFKKYVTERTGIYLPFKKTGNIKHLNNNKENPIPVNIITIKE